MRPHVPIAHPPFVAFWRGGPNVADVSSWEGGQATIGDPRLNAIGSKTATHQGGADTPPRNTTQTITWKEETLWA